MLQDSGVVGSPGDAAFAVDADASGMYVRVQAGYAIVRGHAVQSTAVEQLPISPATSTTRIDQIALRLDPALNSIVLAVIDGIPGTGVPAALTQTDTGVYELPLATVTVEPAMVTIPSSAVTDQRPYTGTRVRAWTTRTRPTNPHIGQLGVNVSTHTWEWWDGTSWSDQTPTLAWSSIAGKPTAFPPTAHNHAWSEIAAPATFPPKTHSHDWVEVTGKPSTFPPSSHSHSWPSITSRPSTFPPSSHSHSSYLTSGSTISWANGSKRVRGNSPSNGTRTWYAVWIDGNDRFCKNTSSRRYKTNIAPHRINPDRVLALRPVRYDRKPTVDADTGETVPGPSGEYGLIAEDVAAAVPELVVHDEDGRPDSVRYDLVGVALLDVVREQQAALIELRRELDRLRKQRHGSSQ